MTMLRDQLSAMADAVDIPPAPTVLDLERGARETRRIDRRWVIAAAAAAAVVAAGSIAWFSRGDDRVEPVGPPTWSDVDVPWTADGVLHWRDARVDVEPLTAYAVSEDSLWLLKDGTLTQILPNGEPITIATDVQGPIAVDPDGTTVAWNTGRRLMGRDTRGDVDPSNDTTFSGSRRYPDALLTALDDNHVWGIANSEPFQSFIGDHTTIRPPGYVPPVTFADRAGWTIIALGDHQRLQAQQEGGLDIDLGRGMIADLGPGAAYVAWMTLHSTVMVTGLPSGTATQLALPAGTSLADAGFRWTSDGDLVVPVTTDPTAKDPEVSWYLCKGPHWLCEAMDVPTQHRSEMPILANLWNFTLAVSTSQGRGQSGSSSSSTPATPK